MVIRKYPKKLNDILNRAIEFAASNKQILAIGLCGSYARGNARSDSDIDLSIIANENNQFKKTNWLDDLEFEKINEELDYYKDEVYGRVWSRHVFLKSKTEIEFSFANRSWADTDSLDEGTKKVVEDGFKILYDPEQILTNLVTRVMKSPK